MSNRAKVTCNNCNAVWYIPYEGNDIDDDVLDKSMMQHYAYQCSYKCTGEHWSPVPIRDSKRCKAILGEK